MRDRRAQTPVATYFFTVVTCDRQRLLHRDELRVAVLVSLDAPAPSFEQTLHLCELAGGWLGGFLARRVLRHKSQKESYQATFWAIVIIHYIAWLFPGEIL